MTSPDEQLPRPAHGSQSTAGPAPTGKGPSEKDLHDEIVRARAELGATIDELTTRLSPGYQAAHLASATRTAAQDAGALLTGNGMPAGDDGRARNVKVLLGAVGAVAVVVALAIVRRAWNHDDS